jgi:type IX secretion system PorP/SprF family membrane protein
VLKRYLLLFVVLLALLPEARAQYDPSFSHYWAMETSFNPAAAGKDPKLNVNGAYNMTLTGFEHYPKTMYINTDMPFYFIGAYHGVGVQVVNDVIGLFSHKKVNVQYAYKQRLLGGTLSIGLQGGLLSESFDGSGVDLETNDGTDLAFSKAEVTGSGFDLGAGLYYLHRNWYVGLSAQHLTSPTVDLGETNELTISRSYYFTGGYNIRLRNPFFTIQTSVLGRTDGVAYRGDVTARLKYSYEKRLLYAGLSYSPTNSVSVLVGGHFHGVMVGYCYEAYTSAISLGNGGHELFVGYQTDIDFAKKGRNRHQSVRIL